MQFVDSFSQFTALVGKIVSPSEFYIAAEFARVAILLGFAAVAIAGALRRRPHRCNPFAKLGECS
jgi:hypothetical protein